MADIPGSGEDQKKPEGAALPSFLKEPEGPPKFSVPVMGTDDVPGPAADDPGPSRRPGVTPETRPLLDNEVREGEQELPSFLRHVEPPTSPGDKAAVFGKSAVAGGLKSGGAVMGALEGGTLGTMLLPGWGTAGGALIGMAGGYYAGDLAAQGLEEKGWAINDPYSLPPHLRSFGVAGEAFGGAFAGPPGMVAIGRTAMRLPDSLVGRMMNGILDMAGQKPVRFMAAETSAAASASLAEGVSEELLPGNVPARLGAGVTAGALNPARLALMAGGKVYDRLSKTIMKWGAPGRFTRAGQLMQEYLKAADEGSSPEVLMRALADTEEIAKAIPGFRGTAAQTSGDQRLAQLEAEMMELDRTFGEEVRQRHQESLTAISNAMALLRGTGDPEAMRTVAELRHVRYNMLMEGLLQNARREAVEKAEAIGQGASLGQRADLSKEVTDIYQRAIERARKVETQLWEEAIPDADTLPGRWKSVQAMSSRLQGDLGPGGELPSRITKALGEVADAQALLKLRDAGETMLPDGTNITKAMIKRAERLSSVGSLMRFRSDLLAAARGAARATDEDAARRSRQYGLMAEAVLGDMVAAGVATRTTARENVRQGQGGLLGATETAFDIARDYSYQFHNTFTRSFVGAAQEQGAYGARVPPETLLKRAFASGDEVATLQLQELSEAVDFLPARTFGNPALLAEANADAGLMMDAQTRLLRIMANRTTEEVTDPNTGETFTRVSLSKAKRFLTEAEDVLSKFPEVKAAVEEAVQSQQHLDNWSRRVQGLQRELDGTSAIGQVLKTESVSDAIRGALASRTPVENLTKMANLAKSGGDDAVAGLRGAIWDDIMRKSENADKTLSLQRVVDSFYDPIRPGLPNMRDFMLQNGIIDDATAKSMDEFVEAATRVMVASEARATGQAVLDKTDALTELFLRAAGSEMARRVLRAVQPEGAGTSGPTLIVAYQGAKAATTLADRIPTAKVRQLFVDALSGASIPGDPQPFSLLKALIQAKGTEAPLPLYMMLHAYAWQSGLMAYQDEYEGVVPPPSNEPELPSFLQAPR